MVIHFCASCDWSVPEQELLTGGAVKLESNRVYCARCVQAGLVTLPQVQAPARVSALHQGVGAATTQMHPGQRPNFAATPHAARSSALNPAVQPRNSGYTTAVQPRNSGYLSAVQPPRSSGIGPAVPARTSGFNQGVLGPQPGGARTGNYPAVKPGSTGQFRAVGGNTGMHSAVRRGNSGSPARCSRRSRCMRDRRLAIAPLPCHRVRPRKRKAKSC
jgi:hypothetical protein